jgi:hypothetical protein
MCLNETDSKIRTGKHLSRAFPIKNGLKQGDALSQGSQTSGPPVHFMWPLH